MRSNPRGALSALLLAAALAAQTPVDLRRSIKVDFPKDAPVGLITADLGETQASARGGALVLDLHTALSLRNSGSRRIRSITLLVLAQEVTPGGKASVAVPSLDVPPGEAFSVPIINLRLLRPLMAAAGPLVEVRLDGVLFDDLSFYGPNSLNSRRMMIAWELEAQRDRRHFRGVLEARGAEGLRREILSSLARQADRPHLDVHMARGRATTAESGQELQLAFLEFPDSPVQPLRGDARMVGAEIRSPRLDVKNRSDRPIRYLEIGWILEDRQGHEFLAGTVPADLNLAPGATTQVLQERSLRFSRQAGPPLLIGGMKGFVRQVEFTDGRTWIPSRASLEGAHLLGTLEPSPEEQRLTELYRRKGLHAVLDELKKF
jgi:hypothetical protein